MKMNSLAIAIVFALMLVVPSAYAIPNLTSGEVNLQEILDDITTNGDSSVDVTTDYLSDTSDSQWQLTASGGSVATIVIEIAGMSDSNSFGVYNGGSKVELFAGVDGSVDQITFSLLENIETGEYYTEVNHVDTGDVWDSQYFGYYLQNGDGEYFYSDTSLNEDNYDHMLAYQGTGDDVEISNGTVARPEGPWTDNEYILAWEDLFNGGDKDYNDFVVMVESVDPVPEPATMLLLGSGLVGMAGLRRRKNRK